MMSLNSLIIGMLETGVYEMKNEQKSPKDVICQYKDGVFWPLNVYIGFQLTACICITMY